MDSTDRGDGSHMKTTTCLLLASLLLATTSAEAQRRGNDQNPPRRLYCWEEAGRKICGDALPASAVDSARTEISVATGLRRAQVGRALTDEERAEAEAAAREQAAAAEAAAAQRRRDIAMADSYATEADLERAYDERIVLVDESIRTSEMGVANLRNSLLTQLRQAAESELRAQPVRRQLSANILSQHADLQRQQAILAQQRTERTHLGADLQEALERYRALRANSPARRD